MDLLDQRWLELAEYWSRVTRHSATVHRGGCRTLYETAIHESAHLVVAEFVGLRAYGATIDKNRTGDANGLVWLSKDTSPYVDAPPTSVRREDLVRASDNADRYKEHRSKLFLIAATNYAGKQSEYILAGDDPDGLLMGSAHDDWCAEFFLTLGWGNQVWQSSAPRFGAQLFARKVLMANWRVVRRLAMALLHRKTLDSSEISRAIHHWDAPAAGAQPIAAAAAKTAAARAQCVSPGSEHQVTAPIRARKAPSTYARSERPAVATCAASQ